MFQEEKLNLLKNAECCNAGCLVTKNEAKPFQRVRIFQFARNTHMPEGKWTKKKSLTHLKMQYPAMLVVTARWPYS